MSQDTATELVDDATIVHDEAAEEKGHAELVDKVAKMLDKTPGDKPEMPGEPEEPAPVKGEKVAAKWEPDVETRLKGAGISEELAQRLQESGHLDETLAAFDRRMIEYVQSKQETPDKDDQGREKEPSPKDVPALDPEVYDEVIVARDAAQTKRIEALESLVEKLVSEQGDTFDQWFDGILEELGCNTSDNDKCQAIFKAYGAVCEAFGESPTSRDKGMVKRAYAAMYPQDVFKKQVARMRDSEGKFVTSPASRGGPPPKGASDEEVQAHLLSRVTSYLKEQNVQMSGY
jgi:hypothetical protein